MAIVTTRIKVPGSFERYRTMCKNGTVDQDVFQRQQDTAGAILKSFIDNKRLGIAYKAYKRIQDAHPEIRAHLHLKPNGAIGFTAEGQEMFSYINHADIEFFLGMVSVLSLGLSANKEERDFLVSVLAEAM